MPIFRFCLRFSHFQTIVECSCGKLDLLIQASHIVNPIADLRKFGVWVVLGVLVMVIWGFLVMVAYIMPLVCQNTHSVDDLGVGDLGVWVVLGVLVMVIWGFWVVVGYKTPLGCPNHP